MEWAFGETTVGSWAVDAARPTGLLDAGREDCEQEDASVGWPVVEARLTLDSDFHCTQQDHLDALVRPRYFPGNLSWLAQLRRKRCQLTRDSARRARALPRSVEIVGWTRDGGPSSRTLHRAGPSTSTPPPTDYSSPGRRQVTIRVGDV
jgi:hypothetical protein